MVNVLFFKQSRTGNEFHADAPAQEKAQAQNIYHTFSSNDGCVVVDLSTSIIANTAQSPTQKSDWPMQHSSDKPNMLIAVCLKC